MTHSTIVQVTQRIKVRSVELRKKFEDKIKQQAQQGKGRGHLSCGNLAHELPHLTRKKK